MEPDPFEPEFEARAVERASAGAWVEQASLMYRLDGAEKEERVARADVALQAYFRARGKSDPGVIRRETDLGELVTDILFWDQESGGDVGTVLILLQSILLWVHGRELEMTPYDFLCSMREDFGVF